MKGGRNGTHLPAPPKVRIKKTSMLSAVHIPRKFYMPDWPEVLLAVGSVSQRMLISPVGLIVNHTRPRFRRTTWQHGWLKRPPLPMFFTRNGVPSRAWPWQIQISLEVVGWAEPVINVFLQYILWGLVSYGLPMPLYAKLTPQNDSQVYIWPSGHRSKLWCFPVMELWAYHRDTSVRYNLPLTIGNLVK